MVKISELILKHLNKQESSDTSISVDDDVSSKLEKGLNGGKLLQAGDTIDVNSYENSSGTKKLTTDINEKTAYDIYNQLSDWSLNSNTIKCLNSISEKNALQVLNYYNKISPQMSLEEAVLNKWGLDINTVKEYILKPLLLQAKAMGVQGVDEKLCENIKDEAQLIRYIKSIQGKMNLACAAQFKTATTNTSKSNVDSVYKENGEPEQKVNPDDYSVESLKKRYPSVKYEIKQSSYDGITIVDKTTGKLVRRVRHENNYMTIEDYDENGRSSYFGCYNTKGELKYYDVKGKRNFPIVNAIYDDIHAKNPFGLPTTGKTLEDNVKKITPENILDVLEAYKNKSNGESLVDAIMSERGLSAEKRAELVKYIKDTLIELARSKGVYTDDIDSRLDKNIDYEKTKVGPMSGKHIEYLMGRLVTRMVQPNSEDNAVANGKIDGNFKQGKTGDCWLIAAIEAAMANPAASKMLNDLISVDDKGNVTVYLKGVNKTYVITKEELEGATELSNGDMDVRAIEIAVNRYLEEEYEHSWNPHARNDIDKGGQSHRAFEILFGKGGKSFLSESIYGSIYDALFSVNGELIEKIKTGKAIVVVSVDNALTFSDIKKAYGEDGNPVGLFENHTYAVVGADDKYVYLTDPHDSSKVLKMTIEDFKDTFNGADVLELED